MPGDLCPSVTVELTSPRGNDAVDSHGNSVYVASNDALVAQTLRDIPPGQEFDASTRSVPYEPHVQYRNQAKLNWEKDETVAFLDRHLSKDPRLKPADIIIDDSHLNFCTSCTHDTGLHTALHGEATIDVGNRTQPFVDDWPISRWQNVVRFLNRPRDKVILDLDDHDDGRFGCPCGSVPTADGGVKLYYSSGPSIDEGPDEARGYKNKYSSRVSSNGVTGWSEEAGIEINGWEHLGTFTPTDTPSLPPTWDQEHFHALPLLAGYEDKHGGACLAFGANGQEWYNIDNEHDATDDGLNDWCLQDSNDYLGRAGDTYVQPVVNYERQKEYIWYRQDFGQEGGWREVRGIQVATLNQRLADIQLNMDQTWVTDRVASWYFDRLGKLEHYRRHVYCATLTPYSKDLWYGLMTVIEWQKDLDEAIGPDEPPFERDTLNVYLVTSRDGVHIDHEWVYAHQPLLPKDGLKQSDWDSGLIMQGAQFMTRGNEHRMYFEARPGNIHHENRFEGNEAKIGTASWELDRVVGLRAAQADAPGVITTKRFRLQSGSRNGHSSIRINVDIPTAACESRILAEVLLAGEDGSDTVAPGLSVESALPIIASSSNVELRWGDDERWLGEAVAENSLIRLRFHVYGAAKLYAFQVVPMPPAPPRPPSPTTPSASHSISRPPSSHALQSIPRPPPSPPALQNLPSPLSPSPPSLATAPWASISLPPPLPGTSAPLASAGVIAPGKFGIGIALLAMSIMAFFYAFKLFWRPTLSTRRVVDASVEIESASTPAASSSRSATSDDTVTRAGAGTGGNPSAPSEPQAKKAKKKKGYSQFDDEDDIL